MNFKIVSKYIKKLDFKIPDAETYSLLSKEISNYKINIDIKSNQIKEKLIEVETSLSLITNKENLKKIHAEIILSAIIELSEQHIDKQKLEKIILVEVPSSVYPEIREIFLFLFKTSGFKEIKINESVNFDELNKKRKNQ